MSNNDPRLKQSMDDCYPMPLDDGDPDDNPTVRGLRKQIDASRKGFKAVEDENLRLHQELNEANARLAAGTRHYNSASDRVQRQNLMQVPKSTQVKVPT